MILRLAVIFFFALVQSCFVHALDRPNFVWLISEDNSKHYLKLFDEHGAETPHITALADHGLVFDRAFSNSPVCSVARTTLMTACYGPRIGTQYHRRYVTVPMPDGVRMFPAYLRDIGYYTSNNRKKDYNAIEGKGVWDQSSNKATWRNRRTDQPFFHMQSFTRTHESGLHFSENEMKSQRTETDPSSVFIPPYHPDTPTFRYTYARYHDRIRQVDQQIGEVIAQLDKDNLLEDTFVFYFGDHGGVLPRGKGYVYESGLHVPLVVRIPENWKHLVDASPGTRSSGFVSFIDFGPTLLNLAGVEISTAVDGRPFLGKGVSLSELNQRDETFGYADRFDEKYDFVRTLRKGRYKYMRSFQPFNFDGLQNNYRYIMLAFEEWRSLYRVGKLNAVQSQFFERRSPEALYDLEKDPFETKNLADDPEHSNLVVDLRNRLNQRIKSLPDLSLYPESHLVRDAFTNPTSFGKAHRDDIGNLVDIADLSLISFNEARSGIRLALDSQDPWERYWALIACSSHGQAASPFIGIAKEIAADDSELLVRVRAAEFLGLIQAADPRPILLECLAKTSSGPEATLMLNTLVLLRDGEPGYKFELDPNLLNRLTGKNAGDVNRRMIYLNN